MGRGLGRGALAALVAGSSFALIALSQSAKATPTGAIELFAGGLGEGPGTEIGGVVTSVDASSTGILYGHPTRFVVRELDRATGNSTVFAGNGSFGELIVPGSDLNAFGMAASDIERLNGDTYISTRTSPNIVKISGGELSIVVPNVAAEGIAIGNDGTVYWSDANTVRRLQPGGTTQVIAGSATAGWVDGAGTSARFNDLRDLALTDDNSILYVSDNGNRRVRAIDLTSGAFNVTTVAGDGSLNFAAGYSGPALGGTFRAVMGLDVQPDGDVLVATGDDGVLRVIHVDETNPANNTMERIAGGNGSRPPTSPPGSNPLTSPMARVYDVSLAPDGAIALGADLGLFILKDGGLWRLGGNYTHGRGGDGGSATGPLATLLLPRGVASDSAGNVYIADSLNNTIRKVDANGMITRFAGPPETFGVTPLGDGGPATSAWMQASGVATDDQGNVYIADTYHDRVRKVGLDGIVTTIAGNGTTGTAGDNGPATAAELDQPWSIAVASNGDVYFTELWQSRVRKVSGGTITTVYDSPGTDVPANGRSSTRAIAVGPDDSVYITDQIAGQIRRILPGGGHEVIAGTGVVNGGGTVLGEGGLATAARLWPPSAVAVDHANNVYLNDHCSIRKIDAVTRIITTLAGNGICGLRSIGGPALSARFGTPTGITIVGTDIVFTDENTHRAFRVADVVPPPAPPEADVLSGKIAFDTQLYAGGPGNREIAVANADGTDIQRLTNAAGHDSDPDFSKSGDRIAWTSDRTGNHEIWTMYPDGTNQVNLSANPAFEADPSWSPAGNRIAFTRDASGSYDIIVKNSDGSGEVNLTATFNTRTAAYPDWFPDGSGVVFQSQPNGGGSFDLYRVSSDGVGLPVQLTNTAATEGTPQVSPDGSKVVYISDAGGSNDIWVMNADGSNQTRLTSAPGAEYLPTFSPDGKYVLFNDNSNELVRIRLDGSNQTTVLGDGVDHFAGSWVDNLTISVGAAEVVAQPASVEGADVLLQPQAPLVSASAGKLSLLDMLNSPGKLSLLDMLGSPPKLALLDMLGSAPKLSLLDMLNSPGLSSALDEISLLSVPIEGGWEPFFDAGEPIQGKSLLDALKSGRRVPLLDVDLSQTPIARVSLFSFFLGQLPIRNLADTATQSRWCTELEKLDDGFVAAGGSDANDCGGARFASPTRPGGSLSASLVELQIQGVPLSLFPELVALTVGGVNWDFDGVAGDLVDTPLEASMPAFIDLAASDIGAVTIGDLGTARDAVVDCGASAGVCDSAETLAFAQNQGAVRVDATLHKMLPAIADHNLVLTVIGLLDPQIRPLQALDPESQVFAAVDEPGVNDVEYSVAFTPVGVANAREATVSVTLPTGFVPVLGSAQVAVGNGSSGAGGLPPMKFNGRTMRVRLEGMTVAAGGGAVLTFKARPGQLLSGGRGVSARVTAPGVDQGIGNRAGVAITERFEPENNFADTPATPQLVPDTMYLTHVAEPGDVDYFTLPMQAGDRVRILLDQPTPNVAGGNSDLDLVVYAPQAATTLPLRATVDSNEAIVPVFDNPNRLGEPVRPDVLQDIDLLPKPVVALSTNRGGFNESVTVLAPVTGNYVVQVSGYNGASSSHPYSLQSTIKLGESIPTCTSSARSLSSPTTGSFPASIAATAETLVLVNESRLRGIYGDAAAATLLGQIQSFAANATVKGAVVSVDGNSAVRAAYNAWDGDPCSVDLANDVVRKINTAVDGLVDLRAGKIKHLVVVGNDDVIPSARIPDLTQVANERSYADAVRLAGNSLPTASALAAGNLLSDDPYGDGAPAPYLGRHLYVSDVALGRLVETPAEIGGQLTNYLNTFSDASSTNDGRLDKNTAFTAGWDFMKDVATEVDKTLDGLTGASASADNQLIGDTWTDTDIEPKFTGANPDLVSLNAHFTHNAFEPPRVRDPLNPGDSRVTTADVDNGTFDGGGVFSMGCHSGLSIPDVIVGAPDAATRDWAQALSAKKATFVGQTGFGYGLQDAIALSEDLMLGFTKNLTTSMTIGQALTFAKHDYLGGLGVYGVYDEKALAQATMYGLPNWKVGTGDIPGAAPALPLGIDDRTGLSAAAFDHADTFTPRTSANGTYWSGSGGTQVTHDRPIQPKSELDVTQTGLVAHGAEITGLTSDEVSANAVFARVVLDDSSRETEVEDPTAIFPAALQRINDVTTPAGERQRLVLLTGQYRATGADADSDVTGAQRFYRRMAGKVHYSTSSDFTSPDILNTESFEVGSGVSFAVDVTDALGASTIKAVSVLYHAVGEGDAGTDVWTRLPLARDPSDPTQWLGTGGAAADGDGEELEYLVVALDAAGNSAYATRKGALYAAAAPPPPPPNVTAAVVGQPSASGWYPSASVELAADDDTTFEYSVDGGAWQPYEAPVPVTGDGTHTVAYRTDDGATGEVIVPIDTAAPTTAITTPPNGATYEQGASVLADYACADAGSGVASCVGTVADGAAIDTSSAGTKTFTVTATDGAGRTSTQQVSYQVTAGIRFDGFYSPVKNPPTLNKQQAGSTVPFKWRLYKASGEEIKDPGSVTGIKSFPIACSPPYSPTGGAAETVPLTKGTVVYDAAKSQFVFNWKTNRLWLGTCRRLEITFTGGLKKYADFQFTL